MMKDSKISVTAFDWVPDFAQGNVRDLRLRWALGEAGFDFDVEVLAQGEQKKPNNIARQPFGQVPVLEVDGVSMFESGAAVWRIAESAERLLPKDPATRDQVFSWYFAALNSVEPDIMTLATLDFFVSDKEAGSKVRGDVISAIEVSLKHLSNALGERDWLVGDAFTVADLMMVTVLRILKHTEIIAGFPTLVSYLARCTERPAFKTALDAQLQTFTKNASKYEVAG